MPVVLKYTVWNPSEFQNATSYACNIYVFQNSEPMLLIAVSVIFIAPYEKLAFKMQTYCSESITNYMIGYIIFWVGQYMYFQTPWKLFFTDSTSVWFFSWVSAVMFFEVTRLDEFLATGITQMVSLCVNLVVFLEATRPWECLATFFTHIWLFTLFGCSVGLLCLLKKRFFQWQSL
jgi:hypothetical protein